MDLERQRHLLHRLLASWVDLLSRIPPGHFRARWREEWRSEIWHGLRAVDGRPGARRLISYSIGAYRDALQCRRLDRRRGRLDLHSQPSQRSSNMTQDLRYAFRTLFKRPYFALTAALTLALGIGANTAIFSVLSAVLLRPMPFPEPDRLYVISRYNQERGLGPLLVLGDEFRAWQESARTFERMSGCELGQSNLLGEDLPEILQTAGILPGFAELSGMIPQVGRLFREEEYRSASPAVVISDELWRRRFRASPEVIGKRIELDGERAEIVGVLSAGFLLPMGWADLFRPLDPSYVPPGGRPHFLQAIGLLRPEAPQEAARLELNRIMQEVSTSNMPGWSVGIETVRDRIVGSMERPLWILQGAVVLVLLIACVNVANLLLSRTTSGSRRLEVAVRKAMGASRGRLIRQLLCESLLLALLGALGGLGLAAISLKLLPGLQTYLPRAAGVSLDLDSLLFTMGVAVFCTLLFGILPALQLSGLSLGSILASGRRSDLGASGRRLRAALTVSEVTLALVLLVGAGLLLQSFSRLVAVSPGFEVDGALLVGVTLPSHRFPEGVQREKFVRDALDRLGSLPGIESVGAARFLPMTGSWAKTLLTEENTPPGFPSPLSFLRETVSPGYFQAMGIGIVRGRDFADSDRDGAAPVAIVNQALADQFQGREILGQEIPILGIHYQVVGVVSNVRHFGPANEVELTLYRSYWQEEPSGAFQIVARRTPLAGVDAAGLTAAIHQVDPDVPLEEVQTLDQLVSLNVSRPRFNVVLLGLFAGLATLLATLGIFGVQSYSVSQRRSEIGVHLALGAPPGRIARRIVGQSLAWTLLGVGLGCGLAILCSGSLASLLFEVSPLEPSAYLMAALLLCGVAALASYLPARRATRVDPTSALRETGA